MKHLILLFLLLFSFLLSCEKSNNSKNIEKYKSEVINVERDFAKMAKEESIDKAFLYFADESAVLKRGERLIQGKKEIETHFKRQNLKDVKLEWKPDFVEVSLSGDLAYTYGNYTYSVKDSTGKYIESRGIFHTVWKKQKDGKWRFVWD
jgi:ketosteroid isomerase-like protein